MADALDGTGFSRPVVRLAEHAPERTVFTRFIPPERAEDMPGTWRRYYERWDEATRAARSAPARPHAALAELVPPATVIDKPVYSAFAGRKLQELLARGAATR